MILVTGGAGFIGSHIVDEYIRRGHQVVVLDNLSSGILSNVNKKAIFYKLDIYKDSLDKVFKKHKIKIINHHAAQIDLRRSISDPVLDSRINIEGSIKLFQCAIKYNVEKIIFASSGGAVYGEQKYFPADETHITCPISPYGVSKLAVEKYLLFYKYYYNLDYVVLRYSNVYGQRQSIKGEAGVISIFCRRIIKGLPPLINGDGKNTRDYVFVGDVVKANINAINYKGSGIFNISTGIETDVNTLFNLLKRISGKDIEAIHNPPIPGEQKRSCLDNRLSQRELKWKPLTDIKEGLKITYEWFKKYKGKI